MTLQPSKRLLMNEIIDGVDELGVLLAGHAKGAYWYGSQLSIEETRRIVPYNNATSLQVTVAVLSVSLAALWRGEGGYQLDRLLYVLRSEGTRPFHNRLESALRQRAPYEYEATRYVYTCTRPTDRLLLPWYGPEWEKRQVERRLGRTLS